MYRIRSHEEAEKDYKSNLAPLTGWDYIEEICETPTPVGEFKAFPTERLDAIRKNHVDRANELGFETTGRAYHEIVSELLDYIEGVRSILKQGHR